MIHVGAILVIITFVVVSISHSRIVVIVFVVSFIIWLIVAGQDFHEIGVGGAEKANEIVMADILSVMCLHAKHPHSILREGSW